MGNMTSNRTVVVAHSGSELYGSDRMLLEDVKGLLRGGWAVTVALPSDGPLVEALKDAGAKVTLCTTPVLRKSIFTPRGALGFAKDCLGGARQTHSLLRDVKPSAVLVNTITIPLWVTLASVTGHKVALHVHESERQAPAPMRLALSLPGTLARRIITNSRWTTESYCEYIPWAKKKSKIIFNGVGGPANPTPPRPELSGPVKLLYVGRLSERKGLMVLLNAVEILQRRDINLELSLVGSIFAGYEAFERELNERIGSLPRPDQVKRHGFQPEVWSYYAEADISIVPSLAEESFGNTAVEGVLANCPVIVSSIGGLKEAVTPYASAISVTPGEPEELAEAIEIIINEWPAYSSAAIRSATQAHRLHDPEKFGEKIDSVLKTMVDRPAASISHSTAP